MGRRRGLKQTVVDWYTEPRQPVVVSPANSNRLLPGVAFHRYFIVPAAFFCVFPVGNLYAWSVFNIPIEQYIELEDGRAAYTVYIAVGVAGLTAAVFQPWVARSGPRQAAFLAAIAMLMGNSIAALGVFKKSIEIVYAGYGLFSGIGLGFSLIAPQTALQQWFPHRKKEVQWLIAAAIGCGIAVSGMLQESISKTPMALLLSGCVYFALMLPSALILRSPPPNYIPPKRNNATTSQPETYISRYGANYGDYGNTPEVLTDSVQVSAEVKEPVCGVSVANPVPNGEVLELSCANGDEGEEPMIKKEQRGAEEGNDNNVSTCGDPIVGSDFITPAASGLISCGKSSEKEGLGVAFEDENNQVKCVSFGPIAGGESKGVEGEGEGTDRAIPTVVCPLVTGETGEGEASTQGSKKPHGHRHVRQSSKCFMVPPSNTPLPMRKSSCNVAPADPRPFHYSYVADVTRTTGFEKAITTVDFWAIYGVMFVLSLAPLLFMSKLGDIAQQVFGCTSLQAAVFVMGTGGFFLVGVLIFTPVFNWLFKAQKPLFAVALLYQTLATACAPIALNSASFWAFVPAMWFLIAIHGSAMAAFPSLLSEVFGADCHCNNALSAIMFTAWGLAGIVGGPIFAAVSQQQQNSYVPPQKIYDPNCYWLCAVSILGLFLCLLIRTNPRDRLLPRKDRQILRVRVLGRRVEVLEKPDGKWEWFVLTRQQDDVEWAAFIESRPPCLTGKVCLGYENNVSADV